MRFALASCGTRGDVEPCAAIGVELQRRGHDVIVAAPPDLKKFVESVGLAAVPYGPDAREIPEFFRSSWSPRQPLRPLREAMEHVAQMWASVSADLKALAEGSDMLITGIPYQEAAANVAEYFDIPLAAWHHLPMRPNGYLVPFLPPALTRNTMTVLDWVQWRTTKKAEDAQRLALGLPKATCPASARMAARRSLEIQAYDKVFFPGLTAEWDERRPIVGALSLQLSTEADDEVAAWVDEGTAPIFFGFGSTPVKSPTELLTMIGEACAHLGERALIVGGLTDFDDAPCFDHVKTVPAVSFARVLSNCRAVVHHGGVGTTIAGMRAGVPSLILWTASDQPIWAAQVRRLKVGSSRRFSATTSKTLVADLSRILALQYVERARAIAASMTTPTQSAAATADLVEEAARLGRSGRS